MAVFRNAVGHGAARDDVRGNGCAEFDIGQLGQFDSLIAHFQDGIAAAQEVIAGMGADTLDFQVALTAALAADAQVIVDPAGFHVEAAQGTLCMFHQQFRCIAAFVALVFITGPQELDRPAVPADGLQGLCHPDGNDNAALHIQGAKAVSLAFGIHAEVRGAVKFIRITRLGAFDRRAVDSIVVPAEQNRGTREVFVPDGFNCPAVDRSGVVFGHFHAHVLEYGDQLVAHVPGCGPVTGLAWGVDEIRPHGKHLFTMAFDEGFQFLVMIHNFLRMYFHRSIRTDSLLIINQL